MIEYSIRKSSRARSVSIRVSPPGEVIVTAPRFFPEFRIRHYVEKHKEWIDKKIQYFRQFKDISFNKNIEKEIAFLGKKYPVELNMHKGNPKLEISYDRAIFYLNSASKKQIKSALEKFYKKQSRKIAENLLMKKLGYIPKLSMRKQKTRWGSCSRKGSISLNWKLCLTPLPVFNYVVCHEITHMKHFNHSKDFWNELSTICPDYKEHKKWLQTNGFLLNYA